MINSLPFFHLDNEYVAHTTHRKVAAVRHPRVLQGLTPLARTLVALILLCALLRPAAAQAQTTIIHVVQPGENLFRISLRYGTTVDAIMTVNGLTSIYIYVGQELVIPDASGEPAPQPTPTPSTDAYVVQPGDTLSSIALRHRVTVWALIQANDLSDWQTIYAGQSLLIPEGATVEETPDPETSNLDTYVVRPGDTLIQIALRFATTAADLANLNGIANPSNIYVGQVLRLTGTAPAPSGGGKYIAVNLSEQHLYAYQGDQLVYSFVASSGAAPYYTRVGEFRVQSKIPNAYGSTWNIWMPHWLGIYWAGSTENGIHALPVMANGATLWAGYLGSPVSYGCIVLGTYEANLLYAWAEIGTPVSIYY
jgi:LysM repeat protein